MLQGLEGNCFLSWRVKGLNSKGRDVQTLRMCQEQDGSVRGSRSIRGLEALDKPQAPQWQRSRTAATLCWALEEQESDSLDKGTKQGPAARTVHLEHGGDLAAQESKCWWNHPPGAPTCSWISQGCLLRAGQGQEAEPQGLEQTPEGGRGEKNLMDFVVVSNSQSQRSHEGMAPCQ